ncbi:MAG: DUF1573 domain-containing protein [Verrucomicrobiales bacterium]|nr:DUF1573 domain-containing protein [Verrucomicrobiales bacterium]
MRHAFWLWNRWGLCISLALCTAAGLRSGGAAEFPDALLFDGTSKEENVTAGATNAVFTFAFTNGAPGQVVIESVRTSCGCTVAKVPTLPWVIPPGGDGEFSVTLDLRGKRGTVTKSVFVNTSMGTKPLTVRAILPDNGSGGAGGGMDDRLRNMQIALADRSAIFRGDCANCHATPASSKHGPALYLAACAICHDSHNRASMVPDLKNLPHPTDRDHWIRWINFGRHGSLMPAFAKAEGGILSDAQIDSLADYLTRTISDRRLVGNRPATPRKPTGPIQYPPLPGGASVSGGARP